MQVKVVCRVLQCLLGVVWVTAIVPMTGSNNAVCLSLSCPVDCEDMHSETLLLLQFVCQADIRLLQLTCMSIACQLQQPCICLTCI